MVKKSTFNAGDLGSVPGLGRYPGEGNPKDKGGWQATVQGLTKSWT